jgi:hypothetical protein
MLLQLALSFAATAAPVDSPRVADVELRPRVSSVTSLLARSDSARQRRAVEYSDAYYTRLTIHRMGSYTMLPLFGLEYYLGNRLLNDQVQPEWLKPTHVGVATGIGALFTVNTVTGLWNLWDARKDPNARTLRYVHSALMIASEAGFALAAAVVDDDEGGAGGSNNRTLHRNIALGSMGLSTLGTAIMWFRRN